MSQEKLRKLHLIYGIALSCIIVITGICFIVSCIDIYKSGMRPFTYESINKHFAAIIVPVILCITGIVGGMVLSFFSLEKPKIKGIIDTGVALNKISKRFDVSKLDSEAQEKIKKEQRLRLLTNVFCIDAITVSAIISLVYTLNKNNFPAKDLNGEVISAMLFIIPCAIVAIGAIFATILICSASYARELDFLKQGIKNSGKQAAVDTQQEKTDSNCEKILIGARLSVLIIAITFIIIGIFNGGMADVLQKAVNICTECIGLG